MVGWTRTAFRHVWERDGRYRVTDPSGEYDTTLADMKAVRQHFEDNGWELVQERNRRVARAAFIEMLKIFLKWRSAFHWDPADKVKHFEVRERYPWLPQAAPCTYALGIQGKEGPFWDALTKAYLDLTDARKRQLLLLTSDVPEECVAAGRVQYELHETAIRAQARPRVRAERSWWAFEVQYLVGHHMGWLGKALSDKIIMPNVRGDLDVGEMGKHYSMVPFNSHHVATYQAKARSILALHCQRVPRTMDDYIKIGEELQQRRPSVARAAESYHAMWYFRGYVAAERHMLGIHDELQIRARHTLDQYRAVFPDSCNHVATLRRAFKTTKLKKIIAKLNYEKLGLSPTELSCDLCFIGHMHSLSVRDMRKVRKRHFAKAMKQHSRGRYQGHPLRIFKAAVRLAVGVE